MTTSSGQPTVPPPRPHPRSPRRSRPRHPRPVPLRRDKAADERQPIRGLRKRIFENMARSKHTAAHFHYIDEVDVAAIIGLKDRARPYAEKAGVKLTFLPFIVKAVVAALKRHPRLKLQRRRSGDGAGSA